VSEELLIGHQQDSEIEYAVPVAHGFSASDKEVTRRLSPLIVPRSPLAGMPRNRKAKGAWGKLICSSAMSACPDYPVTN
jgi:ATP-dependent DNA ligase